MDGILPLQTLATMLAMYWIVLGILTAIFLAVWFVVVRVALRNSNETSGGDFNPKKGKDGGGAGL
jgi:hypothetical protein